MSDPIDRTLGGRLPIKHTLPADFYTNDKHNQYWDQLMLFIEHADKVLPEGYELVHTSGYAPGDRTSNDRGSHKNKPAHDFAIRGPSVGRMNDDEKEKVYLSLMRIAQGLGIKADGRWHMPGGKKHGSAPHIHLQSGGKNQRVSPEELELRTNRFLDSIGAPPQQQEATEVEEFSDATDTQNTHRVLDALDNAFSPEAIKEAESIVAGNPSRDISKRGALQDMQETTAVVWNNFLAGAGDLARGVDPSFLYEALTDKLTKLMEPISRELEPTNEFDSGEESGFVMYSNQELDAQQAVMHPDPGILEYLPGSRHEREVLSRRENEPLFIGKRGGPE